MSGSGLTSTDVLDIPPTAPEVGRASVLFLWVSSVAGSAFSAPAYLTFTPTTGLPITARLGVFSQVPMPTSGSNPQLFGAATFEDTSGNLVDSVASGGTISITNDFDPEFTSLTTDIGVGVAIVLQADSPDGFQMSAIALGDFGTETVTTSATYIGVNKDTGPFISLLTFAAANGGNSPSSTSSDVDIDPVDLIEAEANSAVLSVKSYVSPADWGWTTDEWFVLPPDSPTVSFPTVWSGPTDEYSGAAFVIAHQPIEAPAGATSGPSSASVGFSMTVFVPSVPITMGARSYALIVGA